MLGKLSVALLLAASPAAASDPAAATPPAQEYKIKKVCRTVEVSGSFIPRTSCVNRKIPIKKPDAETQETASPAVATEGSGQGQKEQ